MSDAKKESDDANATKNRVGMVAAEKLLSKWGFSNIRRADHDGEGCDFTALKSGSQCKIELKTTQTNGVPDGYESEFGNLDSLPILTADYLLVVKVEKRTDGKFHPMGGRLVTKEEVGRYKHKHRVVRHVKFANEFQSDLRDGKVGQCKKYEED